MSHVLRHDGLLQKIIEGRMKDKPSTGRRRWQMLYDLTKCDGYAAFKRAAEERKGWRTVEWCQKPSLKQKPKCKDVSMFAMK